MPYRSKPISGELSDAEQALEAEVNDVMAAPKFSSNPMVAPATSYALLKEDLKMRAMQNNELAQRQQIAFASSARRAMHDETVKNNAHSAQAEQAMIEITQMRNDGMAEEDAINDYFGRNPTAPMNPILIEALKPMIVFGEDETDRFLRTQGDKLAKTEILTKNFDADAALQKSKWSLEDMPALRKMGLKAIEAGLLAADAKVYQARIDQMEKSLQWDEAQRGLGMLNKVRQATGNAVVDQGVLYDAVDVMERNGIFITDPVAMVQYNGLDDYQLGFMADQASINEFAMEMAGSDDPVDVAKARGQLVEALGALSDPVMLELAEQGDTDATKLVNQGRSAAARGAGVFRRRYKRQLQQKEAEEKLAARSKLLTDPYRITLKNLRENLLGEKQHPVLAREQAVDFVNQMGVELGVRIGSALTQEEKVALIKANDPRFVEPEEMNDEGRALLAERGEQLGLWINDRGAPLPPGVEEGEAIKWDDGTLINFELNLDQARDYEGNLRAWMNDRIRQWAAPPTQRTAMTIFGTEMDPDSDRTRNANRQVPIRRNQEKPAPVKRTLGFGDMPSTGVNEDFDYLFGQGE